MNARIPMLTLLGSALLVAAGALAQDPAQVTTEGSPDVTAADESVLTPADDMANRVRSIRRNEYFYQSYGRPDLFAALVTGEFEPSGSTDVVDVNHAKLVGVMWGASDRFALVEDGSGNGFILRVGDAVNNGRVVAIQEDSLVASISLYGITTRVILRLEDGKDKR